MTRASAMAGVLLAAATLHCADARAQARGPSAKQVQEEGQKLADVSERRERSMEAYRKLAGIEPEVLASTAPLDAVSLARKNAEQAAWLTRLPGRYRISGRVEKREYVPVSRTDSAAVELSGDISGVADCAAIGAGAGVHCIVNATWPILEPARGGDLRAPPPPSERVRVFRPVVMVLGLLPNTAEIRAAMVTDEGMAHTWTGRLEEDILTVRRATSCSDSTDGRLVLIDVTKIPPPCFQPLRILAEPNGRTIVMVHKANGVTMQLSLQRDPAAQPEKPMKTKKVR
jgi:hypothetical protein